MHRHILVGFVCATVIVGCGARTPVSPDVGKPSVTAIAQTQPLYDERYRLWGEWEWRIPETHDRVDVVPRRTVRGHLNVLKWVEDACYDCVKILGVHKNGDSTIDVMVRVKHPMPGEPQYTGFDVKGIIMFNGSHELLSYYFFPYPDNVRISWRGKGDPELLNPDGYTVRWSPQYPSGSSLSLLSYWPGKYSHGTPTANLNAYINIYTVENRHMFPDYAVKSRVYHIYLPPGPVAAGYAVEACWMPPDKTPVTDPASDFPISANQDEPYYLRMVINNDQPITESPCCGGNYPDRCSDLRLESLLWYHLNPPWNNLTGIWTCTPEPYLHGGIGAVYPCPVSYPEWLAVDPISFSHYSDGTYRGFAVVWASTPLPDYQRLQVGYTVFDWTVDKE